MNDLFMVNLLTLNSFGSKLNTEILEKSTVFVLFKNLTLPLQLISLDR